MTDRLTNAALSEQLIEASTLVITGGSHNSTEAPLGLYRSGWAIQKFIRRCGFIEFDIGSKSRVTAVDDALTELNLKNADHILARIMEAAADPRDYIESPDSSNGSSSI